MNIGNQLGKLKKSDQFCIYLRKSRADAEAEKLGEGETLARHERILTELAVKLGLPIGKIYRELVSGETISARKEIQSMINDCYAGMWKGILVVEVTRLSRGNQGDAQIIMDCLRYSNNNNGVLVVTPTKVYDIVQSSDDEEYMEFELFMSRREYKMIRKRMMRGKLQAVVEGNYMGSYRPYGYDILKTKTGRTLVPNPEEAPIVKNIFEWTVKEHLTPGKICKRLNTIGVPTYSGDPEWSVSSIKTILTNPTYTGKVRWNDRMQVKTMVDGKLVKSRPRSNHTNQYMLYDGKHEAIIDEITFHAAASHFHSDKTKANLKLMNPFAGILICAKCKKTMIYQGYNKRPNTPPRILHKSSQICNVKSAVLKDVMDAVAHALELYIDDFEMKIDNLPVVDENNILSQLEALQKELIKQEKKLPKLFDAWENGILTDDEFTRRKLVNKERIESIKKQMDHLEDSIPTKDEYEEKIMCLSDALKSLLDPTLDADIKNTYLKSIISSIEYSRDNNTEFILDVFLKD